MAYLHPKYSYDAKWKQNAISSWPLLITHASICKDTLCQIFERCGFSSMGICIAFKLTWLQQHNELLTATNNIWQLRQMYCTKLQHIAWYKSILQKRCIGQLQRACDYGCFSTRIKTRFDILCHWSDRTSRNYTGINETMKPPHGFMGLKVDCTETKNKFWLNKFEHLCIQNNNRTQFLTCLQETWPGFSVTVCLEPLSYTIKIHNRNLLLVK